MSSSDLITSLVMLNVINTIISNQSCFLGVGLSFLNHTGLGGLGPGCRHFLILTLWLHIVSMMTIY